MRTVKIFALPSHQTKERTSGVDFARIIQPMKHLNGYTLGNMKFKVDVFDIEKKTEWLQIAQTYDIIYLNYINNPWGFAAMGAMARKYGVKMVFDIDDSLWNIKRDNSAYEVYKKGSEALQNLTAIINEVDYVTTTNDYLKHVIINNTTKRAHEIKVFPNYVDLSIYNHISPFKESLNIQLMHYGSTTHFNDLQNEEFNKGIDKLFAEYPNVTLRFVGAFIPQYRERWGSRYENAYGDQDIYKWIEGPFRKYMDEADILVVPLTEDIYNKAKSNIKFLEASSAKKPGVYQNIRQYSEIIEHGKNGFLASKSSQWYKALKQLVDDAALRKQIGEAAYQTIVDGHQMKDHVNDYAEFFKRILV